jgi:hypothetical protein
MVKGLVLSVLLAGSSLPAAASERVELRLDTSEAEAVLHILAKRESGRTITGADWERLFATEPYRRLKQREASLRRDFSDQDFRAFVLSDELARRAPDLRRTLEQWRRADLVATAGRILPYLPASASVRAKVYPVIKPAHNSFVFEVDTDPAIFLYLNPEQSRAEFENTVAHECHHIGFADADRRYEQAVAALPAGARKAAEWMGAFGEGLAVLAAAGSIDVHPLRDFSAQDRARWDQDMTGFDSELRELDQFFLDAIGDGFARPEIADHVGFAFLGYRGPWYVVGYRLGAEIERRFGRAVLVECMGDPRQLVARYNQAAAEHNAAGKLPPLPLFSAAVLEAVLPEGSAAGRSQ